MKHPCHKNQISSLRRIKGQLEGVERMIEQGKYCVDILNQIKAPKNAISTSPSLAQPHFSFKGEEITHTLSLGPLKCLQNQKLSIWEGQETPFQKT